MIRKVPLIVRGMAIIAAATFVSAAGQFPAAPTAAVELIAPAGPASPIPAGALDATTVDIAAADDTVIAPRPAHLAALVAETIDANPTAYGERDCLARAVYFEARGEPLEGQLAVAQVILNRVASGRYASTVCGVIGQRGQFSFDRSRVPAEGRDWRTAKAIAAIAATARWDVVAPKALSFHATRVSTGWTQAKISTIGNHIFYR